MQDLIRKPSKSSGRWTKEEHLKFLEGLRIHGKNWKKIQQLIQTRSASQVRSHAQKFFLRVKEGNTSEPSEYTQNSGEFQDDSYEPTSNSKMVSETKVQQQSFSYFLMKIVTYTSHKRCLDFWADMIDCKLKIDEDTENENNQSFSQFISEKNSISTSGTI